MATPVTYNNTVYSIPAAGELNWSALSAFLIDVGNTAQTTTFSKQNTRIATSTPVTVVAATDVNINVNIASAATVNLPAGAAGQVFRITDSSGAAATNNITIDGNAAETINGAATYVINTNNGGITIAWNGTEWRIVSEAIVGEMSALTVKNNSDPTFTLDALGGEVPKIAFALLGSATGATISATADGDIVVDATLGEDLRFSVAGNRIATMNATGFAVGTSTFSEFITFSRNQNANTTVQIENNDTGANAKARIDFITDAVAASIYKESDAGASGDLFFINNSNVVKLTTTGQLWVEKADSGAAIPAETQFIVENSDNTGVALLGGTSSIVQVTFGSSSDSDAGRVEYNTSDNEMALYAGGNRNFYVNSTGGIFAPSMAFSAVSGTVAHIRGADNEVFAFTSSARYKENIRPLEDYGLETLEKLMTRRFTDIRTSQECIGMIAEEVFEVCPEIVVLDDDGKPLSIDYALCSPILINAIIDMKKRLSKIENGKSNG